MRSRVRARSRRPRLFAPGFLARNGPAALKNAITGSATLWASRRRGGADRSERSFAAILGAGRKRRSASSQASAHRRQSSVARISSSRQVRSHPAAWEQASLWCAPGACLRGRSAEVRGPRSGGAAKRRRRIAAVNLTLHHGAAREPVLCSRTKGAIAPSLARYKPAGSLRRAELRALALSRTRAAALSRTSLWRGLAQVRRPPAIVAIRPHARSRVHIERSLGCLGACDAGHACGSAAFVTSARLRTQGCHAREAATCGSVSRVRALPPVTSPVDDACAAPSVRARSPLRKWCGGRCGAPTRGVAVVQHAWTSAAARCIRAARAPRPAARGWCARRMRPPRRPPRSDETAWRVGLLAAAMSQVPQLHVYLARPDSSRAKRTPELCSLCPTWQATSQRSVHARTGPRLDPVARHIWPR